ncbi:MAG: STAS domain-containing protein [Pseudonocardiaceae bacterium]
MEKVDFLDSAGLGVLVAGLKRVRAHDGSLRLLCTQERILKIFRITGLTKVSHPSQRRRRRRSQRLRFQRRRVRGASAHAVHIKTDRDSLISDNHRQQAVRGSDATSPHEPIHTGTLRSIIKVLQQPRAQPSKLALPVRSVGRPDVGKS